MGGYFVLQLPIVFCFFTQAVNLFPQAQDWSYLEYYDLVFGLSALPIVSSLSQIGLASSIRSIFVFC